jgi:aminoglycoside phosphotransferase (APT) family kinase protein
LGLDIDAVLHVWDEAMAVAADCPDPGTHWLHGDLLAENLLVRNGRLAAVLDFGGLAVGDPTVDLVTAWELLEPEARAHFRTEAGLDDRTWSLGRAWALAIAVMTFPTTGRRCPALREPARDRAAGLDGRRTGVAAARSRVLTLVGRSWQGATSHAAVRSFTPMTGRRTTVGSRSPTHGHVVASGGACT